MTENTTATKKLVVPERIYRQLVI